MLFNLSDVCYRMFESIDIIIRYKTGQMSSIVAL